MDEVSDSALCRACGRPPTTALSMCPSCGTAPRTDGGGESPDDHPFPQKQATMRFVLGALIVLALATRIASADPTAEDLYRQGQAAYDNANYRDAIAKWKAAYDVSGASGLLFNLAQARRLAGECRSALSTYRHFVAAEPRADQRAPGTEKAEDWVEKLTLQCGQPATEAVGPAPHGHDRKLVALATAGAGVVLFGIGLAFGNRASGLASDVTSACKSSCIWDVEKSKDADGHRDADIGWVLDGLGLAAIATGAGLFYWQRTHRELPVAVQPQAGGASLMWSGQW